MRERISELIIFHKTDGEAGKRNDLLKSVISSKTLSVLAYGGPTHRSPSGRARDMTMAIPEDWAVEPALTDVDVLRYDSSVEIPERFMVASRAGGYLLISNGAFHVSPDQDSLKTLLTTSSADVIAINTYGQSQSYHENMSMAADNRIAGFRRFYFGSITPLPLSADWPQLMFVRLSILEKLLIRGQLTVCFKEFVERGHLHSLNFQCFSISGDMMDLRSEGGLLRLVTGRLSSYNSRSRNNSMHHYGHRAKRDESAISASAKVFGEVLMGKNVTIADKAIVAGPAIIGDNVAIGAGAVVRSTIIGPGVSIARGSVIQNHVLTATESNIREVADDTANNHIKFDSDDSCNDHSNFRQWPKFSYVRFGKRIFDIAASTIVLTLFAPFFPLIAIAVKLNSPGPVFYKDRRQGMHGKDINCLKFRSMVVSADKIQEKLRGTNQVDGPQFKMEHDPRITAVGRFLRETYIDEIPQFINVLLGQMSTVGPRPSPEKENRLCPAWRDARLSVRPGITGLWQVRRTRLPGRDFQEWILYDTKYVRDLSWQLDMRICWDTAKKLVSTFFNQF